MPSFTYHGRVAMHDTDAAGIVYFANYFHFAEEAETRALAALGTVVTRDGYLYPRVHVSCDYHAPLHFFDEYTIRASLIRMGATSLHWQFLIFHGETLCATIRVISSRRHQDNTPAPYSKAEKQALSAWYEDASARPTQKK